MTRPQPLGELLRQRRLDKRLGLRQAADLIGISPSYLSKVELGQLNQPPSGKVLHEMSRVLDIPLRELETHAPSRQDEILASDRLSPVMQALFRVTSDQPEDVQISIFQAAIKARGLSQEDEEKLLEEVRRLIKRGGQELARLGGPDDLFALNIHPRILSGDRIEKQAEQTLSQWLGRNPTVDDLAIDVEQFVQFWDESITFAVDDSIDRGFKGEDGPTVLGVSRWSRDGARRELVIHSDLFGSTRAADQARCRFTMAHELYHCIEHLPRMEPELGPELRRGLIATAEPSATCKTRWFEKKRSHTRLKSASDWREWQANRFAAAVLMPRELVKALVTYIDPGTLDDVGDVNELADNIARADVVWGDLNEQLFRIFGVNPQAMAIRLLSLGLVPGVEE